MSKLVFKPNNHIPFPQEYMTTITASAAGYITAAGATQFQQSFPANYSRHPFAATPAVGAITWFQITAATYNPPGHSFLLNNSLYNRAICYSSRIELDICPEGTADVCDVSLTPSDTTGTPSTYASATTAAFTKTYTAASARMPGGRGQYPIKYFMKIHDFLGINKIVYNSQVGSYDYLNNTPPTSTVFWSLNVQSADGVAWTNPVPLRIRITYYVKFFDLASAAFSA